MLATAFIDNAKVMSKGQITIPKDIRKLLGLSCGDRVSFIVDTNRNAKIGKLCNICYAGSSKRYG